MKSQKMTVAIAFFAGTLFMGVCANSESGIAFAHGIINAFGIEYDNSGSGLVAVDVQAAIDEQDATIATFNARIDELESNPCDPDGDGVITPDEMYAYTTSNGLGWSFLSIGHKIGNAEGSVNSPMSNGLLDTPAEITEFNALYLVPTGITTCPAN